MRRHVLKTAATTTRHTDTTAVNLMSDTHAGALEMATQTKGQSEVIAFCHNNGVHDFMALVKEGNFMYSFIFT